jgi:hypothetical protein
LFAELSKNIRQKLMTKATVLEVPKGWRVTKQVDTEVDGLYIVMAGEFNFKAGRHCDSD